jgi:cation transport regulator ChaC
MATEPLWIFGYGSLVWRPAFPHTRRQHGYVRGWTRRFWQGSTDHRGVPGAPGRVATVIPESDAHCWGSVYHVDPLHREEVMARLDHREKGGYERERVEVWLTSRERVQALMYVATPRNDNWLGEAPLEDIAAQILRSRGPSGPNPEYLLRLHDALVEMGAEDPHVASLARLVESRT